MKRRIIFILMLMLISFTLYGCADTFALSLSYKVVDMNVGEIMYLSTNSQYEEEVVWSSTDPEVVSVSDFGKVEALSAGDAYVVAKYLDKESKVLVVVHELIDDSKHIKITGKQLVYVNEIITLGLEGDILDSDKFVWSSSDTNIATVDNNGNVSGIKPGLVNIRACHANNTKVYADYSVLVKLGSGVQDVIYNYIYNYNYNISGEIDLTSLNNKVTTTVENFKDAVLGVSNYVNGQLSSIGSGVIFNKEVNGEKFVYKLLTNYHVIEDATQVKIYIGNDLEINIDAEVLYSDKDYDLALLQFEYDVELPSVALANENSYSVGDFVIAIGNPTSYDFYNSVTFGVISYKGRTISGEKSTLIQHDAAINPGNSGGPLLTLEGELIGINTLKLASATIEGMGFAVDLPTINTFLEDSKKIN